MKSIMKAIVIVLCILFLTGCVTEPAPEAYDAVSRTCIEQGKVMHIQKSPADVVIECVDP